ncbi:MAG: DegT/DnrJ/EryC1/StrS family aminotransferase [Oscillospiraceae bacterium]|nr:DegT/DnrJ/EryC1/StrS family aminotransferase [Oscillospiraceae bacterium]
MLAIFGGEPAVNHKFPSWPVTGEPDRNLLTEVLRDGSWSGGEKKKAFEERFAADCGVKHCFAVSNGTVSLEMILRGFGIGRGDEVILPPYTFIATLSSIVFAGATPVFADIDPETYNISPAEAEKKITPRTRAIVAVAIGGCPPDLDALTDIARKHGIKLIVDAAQGVGAVWNGKSICAWGDAASVSCQNTKNLTCGEGGIITTDDDALAERIAVMLNGGEEDGVYTAVSQDHSITEFQAALLLSQYEKLDSEMRIREENAAYLREKLTALDFLSPVGYDERIGRHAWHLFILRLNSEKLTEKGITREQFVKAVSAEGIPLSCGYMPLYSFPCVSADYTERLIGGEIGRGPLPVCETAARLEGTWITQDALLGSRADMDAIVDGLKKVWAEAESLRAL